MNLKPLEGRVVLEVEDPKEVTKGGIVIPDIAKEKPEVAKVLAVSDGKRLDNGEVVPPSVKVGDRVLFQKYAGTVVSCEDKKYTIIQELDLLAKFE